MKKRVFSLFLALVLLMSVFACAKTTVFAASVRDTANSVTLYPLKTGYDVLDELVEQITKKIFTSDMTAYDKLKACYDYVIYDSEYGEGGNTHNTFVIRYNEGYRSERDAFVINFAYSFLTKRIGYDDDFACAFIALARAIGYKAYYVTGNTRLSSGGYAEHSWAVIEINGAYYSFDPQVEYNITSRRSDGKITYARFFSTDKQMEGRLICTDREKDVSLFGNFEKYGFFKISAAPNRQGKVRTGTQLEFTVTAENPAETYRFDAIYIKQGKLTVFNTSSAEKLAGVTSSAGKLKWTADRTGEYTIAIIYVDGMDRVSPVYIFYDFKPKNDFKTDERYAFGISSNTASSELPLKDGETFLNAKGEPITSDTFIGTGFSFVSGDVTLKVYVKGDTDGDGTISVTDYLIIKRCMLKLTSLQNEFFKSADIDEDGGISSTDYVLVKQHLLNLTDIYAA